MATKLYFRSTVSDFGTGNNDANLRGSAIGWYNRLLSTTAGSVSVVSATQNAIAGPTNGLEVGFSSVGPYVWYSLPLDAAATISGSITWNLWAAENAMTDNVAINGRLEVIDGATGAITLIDQTARTAEIAVTTRAVNNFAETPAAGVACKRGDRLRVRIFGDDVGTMAAGGAFTFGFDFSTGSVDGDSWLQLTENLTFVSEPAGTTIYPTDTASAVSTASVDREAWTSRGAGVQTDVRNTTAGWTAPLQITDTAGGTVVDWFTRPLAAFTLGGAVRVNARAQATDLLSDVVLRCEVARVDGDGTNATAWAATTMTAELTGSEAVNSFLVSGDDLAISDGQRLRIRFLIDDYTTVDGPMTTGKTVTLYYAGTSGGASGDTYLTFTQTLTEYTAAQTVTPTTAALVATKFAPTVTASDHQLVTVPTAGGAGYAATVMADSPRGYWRLGEASGNPQDSSGNANHVTTVLGTPVYGVTGALSGDANTAITFDGTTEYLTAPDHTTLDLGDVFTIEAWINRQGTTTGGAIISKGTTAYFLRLYGSGELNLQKQNQVDLVESTSSVPTTGWHHVVATKNGATVKVYIDAVDVTGTVTNATCANTADALHIAARSGGAEWGAGTLDEVALYPTALSAAQVLAHYTAGTTAGLVLTTFAPTVTVAAPQLVTPTTLALTATKYAPTVAATDNQLVTPTTKAAVLATFVPTVTATDHQAVTPTTKALTLTTFAPTVSTPELATPSTVSLALATFAPGISVSDHQAVTPTTAALTLATFAPTVTAPDPQLITPTTTTVTLTTFAPTVTAAAGQTVTPTTASLTVTTFAPVVSATDNQLVTPTTKTAILATFAPTVTATDLQLVTPTTKTLTLTTFAPTVTAAAHQQVTPPTAALILQAFAPTVTATDHQAVTPTTRALALAAFAPTVLTPELVTPTTKALVLATFAPTVSNPDPQLVTPTTKSLTVTKFAPSISISDAASIVPPNAALTLTTYAPTVIQPDPQLVTPTTPALELHTFEPVVTATAHQAVIPTTAGLVTTRHIPTVAATANQSATPNTKALTLTTYAPAVTVNSIVATVTIGLTLTTFAPSVTAGTNTYAFPDPASLVLTGYAPFIDLSAFKLVTPATAVLVITTYPPTAEQHSITPLPTPIYGFAIVASGPGAGVGSANGGATVTTSEGGSTAVSSSGPSARVTIR